MLTLIFSYFFFLCRIFLDTIDIPNRQPKPVLNYFQQYPVIVKLLLSLRQNDRMSSWI